MLNLITCIGQQWLRVQADSVVVTTEEPVPLGPVLGDVRDKDHDQLSSGPPA